MELRRGAGAELRHRLPVSVAASINGGSVSEAELIMTELIVIYYIITECRRKQNQTPSMMINEIKSLGGRNESDEGKVERTWSYHTKRKKTQKKT